MRGTIVRELRELVRIPGDALLATRRRKFRHAGALEGRFPLPPTLGRV